MTPLERIALFHQYLGRKPMLVLLYLISKYDDLYLSDLATILDVPQNQLTNYLGKMEKAGIIKREYHTRTRGMAMKPVILPEAYKLMKPHLNEVGKDPKTKAAIALYKGLKLSKQLLNQKYEIS